jgi:hypothetical protein
MSKHYLWLAAFVLAGSLLGVALVAYKDKQAAANSTGG